jgi:hypothetical protein
MQILLDVLEATIRGASAPASDFCADYHVPLSERRQPSRSITIPPFSFQGVNPVHARLLCPRRTDLSQR